MLQTLALAASLALASAVGPSTLVDTLGPVKKGEPMPTFAGWTLDGKMLSLNRVVQGEKDEAKAPVVVTFFATWCKPCEHGLPILDKVAREKGAKLVLVAYGQEADVVKPFLSEKGIARTCILDPYLKVSSRSGVDDALPRTFVLDEKGVVRAIFTLEGDDFETALAAAVEGAKGPVASPVVEVAPKTGPEKRPPPSKRPAQKSGAR